MPLVLGEAMWCVRVLARAVVLFNQLRLHKDNMLTIYLPVTH